MEIWSLIEQTLSESMGHPVTIASRNSVPGGCINSAYSLLTDSGERFFVKTNNEKSLPSFKLECLALNEISNTNTIRVPKPLATGSNDEVSFLLLELIQEGHPMATSWTTFGEQLAALHRTEYNRFGWKHDNTIGATPQPNQFNSDWIDFFREHRLKHQIRLSRSKGFYLKNGDRLLENLESLFEGYHPAPSLLHGDLWSGNASFDTDGTPFIFDPCSYYGDRETDLAFTEFFGGFQTDFYQAYNRCWPLHPGYELRKTLYNLYHCLNHFYLFGGHYANQAQHMTDHLLSEI